MLAYRHISVNPVGAVAVIRFLDRKILDDLVIQELGQELTQLDLKRKIPNWF